MTQEAVSGSMDKTLLYKPASWLAKIDFINQLVITTNVWVLVVGEQGCGKTSFAQLLCQQAAQKTSAHYFEITQDFSERSFVSQLSQQLNMPGADALEHLMASIQQQQQSVFLILDDADRLPGEFLNKLMQLTQSYGSKCCLHICMLGTKALLKEASSIQVNSKEESLHSVELPPFSQKEMKEYLLHRLINLPEYISKDKFKAFFDETGGKIPSINAEMSQFLSFENSPKANDNPSTQSGKYKGFTSAALVLVLAIGFGFLFNRTEQVAVEPVTQVTEVAEISEVTTITETVQAEGVEIDTLVKEDTVLSSIPPYDIASVRQFSEEDKEAFFAEMNIIEEDEHVNVEEMMVVVDKVLVAPKKITKHSVEQQASSELNTEVASALDAEKSRLSLKQKQKNTAQATSNQAGTYTIQLIASTKRSEIERFAREHKIQDQAHIALSRDKNQTWYVLTLGKYPDISEASSAIKALPKELSQYKPWIRKSSHLKALG